jgi:ubiquinone biosynthesis protein UbiJ
MATMLTDVLENTLNRNLPRSPRARELAAALRGRGLEIEVRDTPWRLRLESDGALLHLRSDPARGAPADAKAADATLSGSALALVALAGSDPEGVIRRGEVRISGDAQVAQSFRELTQLLRPDLEEELSRFVGDGPAHQALRLVGRAVDFGRRSLRSGALNIAEFLSHESRDTVPKPEAESLFRDIDGLREDVDRLEARIALLARRTGGTGENA